MSESDSDLEFESADEDTSCDFNAKNNNTPQNTFPTESINKDPPTSLESSNTETRAPETFKDDSCTDEIRGLAHNLDNKQITETSATDNNVNTFKASTENIEKESEWSPEKVSLVKPVKLNIPKENFQESTPAETKIHQEKQRVTLRLEKKIQQKQQMSKDNSVEEDATVISSENSSKKQEQKSSWGFGSWGNNLLSSAASSVSTFTNQVSQGIGTVLETVESSLGAPPPEELATSTSNKKDSDVPDKVSEEECSVEEETIGKSEAKSSILPNVSSWTRAFENTGSKVLMGGLDTLELIGKKTIDIITEGDPGLRKKRAVFSDGNTLSQLLHEAKSEADVSNQGEDSEGIETVNYSQVFDEYQGLAHLEALEMLSKQSEAKLGRNFMRVSRNPEIRKNMNEIKSICEYIPPLDDLADCGDFEDFVTVCKKHVLELNLNFNVENIIITQQKITKVIQGYESATATTTTLKELYQSAVCSLAEFTAKSVETFHKLGELILVQPILEPDVEHFATNITGLTTVMCIEINNLSSRFHRCLESIAEQYESDSSEKTNVTVVVTNLYLEAGNSNKYIQDAFLLLVPVLQVSLLESLQ